MSQLIIYQSETGNAILVIPAPNCGISVEEIARKDVPAGLPYHIVDAAQVPADRTFYEAWEADFTNPTGRGIGAQAWFAEQAAKEQA
jgi:hypothetical protein